MRMTQPEFQSYCHRLKSLDVSLLRHVRSGMRRLRERTPYLFLRSSQKSQ